MTVMAQKKNNMKKGPFKMKGFAYPGTSPAKNKPKRDLTEEEKLQLRYVEMSDKYEDDPGFKEARDKVFGGTTTVKGMTSTTSQSKK